MKQREGEKEKQRERKRERQRASPQRRYTLSARTRLEIELNSQVPGQDSPCEQLRTGIVDRLCLTAPHYVAPSQLYALYVHRPMQSSSVPYPPYPHPHSGLYAL